MWSFMEELNLTELLRYYLKRLPIIAVILVVVLLVGYIYIKNFQVPFYHGTTTIILVQKQSEEVVNATITQSALTINEKLVSTYSEIIKSRRVLGQVITTLKLDTTTSELASRVAVSSVKDTSIIKISVSDENNNLAVKIANNLALVFKEEISKIYNLENISVIDEAIVEDEPYNINVAKQLVIYLLVALVMSCAVIFVIYYFDNKIKNKKEIETKLNLPVIGEVPMVKR